MDAKKRDKALLADTEGLLYLEYLILVGAVGLAVATGVMALGIPLLRAYRYLELIVTAPA